MAEVIDDRQQWQERRIDWTRRVDDLVGQIEGWAREQKWDVTRAEAILTEKSVGQYSLPNVRITLPNAEIHVQPVGMRVIGGEGRVDIEAFPTLNRVSLIMTNDGWEIWTDSNIPLRQPWAAATFVQLVKDLVR